MMWRVTLALLCVASHQSVPQPPVFRAAGRTVVVPVSVKDRNVPVTGLTAADFRLWDSGVEQTVTDVGLEDVPVDVTVFLDNSGSTTAYRLEFNENVQSIVSRLRPIDRIRVLTFDLDVRVHANWTTGGPGAQIPPVPPGRLSSVNDALYLALWHRPDPGRRHLIVAMTDGIDTASVIRSLDVERLAGRSEGVLHIMEVRSAGQSTIAAVPSEPREGPEGHARLRRVAELTGGTVHAPFLGPNIVQSFMRVYDDFKSSYVLRYVPAGVPSTDWHPIKVDVRSSNRLTIRHRQGYAGSR